MLMRSAFNAAFCACASAVHSASTTVHIILMDCSRFASFCCEMFLQDTCKFSKMSGGDIYVHMVWHCKKDQQSFLCPCSTVGILHYGHCNLFLWPHLQSSCLLQHDHVMRDPVHLSLGVFQSRKVSLVS